MLSNELDCSSFDTTLVSELVAIGPLSLGFDGILLSCSFFSSSCFDSSLFNCSSLIYFQIKGTKGHTTLTDIATIAAGT